VREVSRGGIKVGKGGVLNRYVDPFFFLLMAFICQRKVGRIELRLVRRSAFFACFLLVFLIARLSLVSDSQHTYRVIGQVFPARCSFAGFCV
jgi:hypothetical protein